MPIRSLTYLPHYTYQDYIRWEGRWELIYGIPYAMSPSPNSNHQFVSGNVHAHLLSLLALKDCRPYFNFDWKINDDLVVCPDNMVCCFPIHEDAAHITQAPSIVFEILSPSTFAKDRSVKYQIYLEQGVKYYVIVDPKNKKADIFLNQKEDYDLVLKATTEVFSFEIECGTIDFNFSKIFN